jgi:hypothetical protein
MVMLLLSVLGITVCWDSKHSSVPEEGRDSKYLQNTGTFYCYSWEWYPEDYNKAMKTSTFFCKKKCLLSNHQPWSARYALPASSWEAHLRYTHPSREARSTEMCNTLTPSSPHFSSIASCTRTSHSSPNSLNQQDHFMWEQSNTMPEQWNIISKHFRSYKAHNQEHI